MQGGDLALRLVVPPREKPEDEALKNTYTFGRLISSSLVIAPRKNQKTNPSRIRTNTAYLAAD